MTDSPPGDRLSTDDFLGGRLKICQPRTGYRAGVDPVLLAAAVPARPGDSVLELGCGVGTALSCLAARVHGLRLTGLEIQPEHAALARRNARQNAQDIEVIAGDLSRMPETLRQRQFTHVMANPPYFDRSAGPAARDAGRETAMGEGTALSDWVRAAAKRTAPKGHVTIIQRAERLPELIAAAGACLGSLEVLPLIPRRGRPARLVLLRARKGGRAEFRLHDGWVLHEGPSHDGDRENYTNATAYILRHGGGLQFPD